MSAANPAFVIPRQAIGDAKEYVKMFDPRPVASPATPERLNPTNPVPEVMQARGLISAPIAPHTVHRQLLNALVLPTWDGVKNITFFAFNDPDLAGAFSGAQYPAPTTRVPRGVVFHGQTVGKGPPPHTIHWHGIEPTPINDGVGHCSMEIGSYTYQWQPNFIGTYFYHCHRNTMQHFEFGLFGLLIIEPPDAYFASVVGGNPDRPLPSPVVLNNVPIGACSDRRFRTAAAVADFPQFPGFIGGHPVNGVGNGDPHAYTVPYDVEVLWVLDDRDSTWSDMAAGALTTFPAHGNQPGVTDQFAARPGVRGFFNFNDFRADYWYVTGVPVRAHRGETGPLFNPTTVFGTADGTIPAALNSGRAGSQVAINARVGQTILVRCLDAAYAGAEVTFPVDVVIIAWDGRALGVPPFGLYNSAFLLPAGTPIAVSTARRFDALIRTTRAFNSRVKVDFFETRGGGREITCNIPFTVTA